MEFLKKTSGYTFIELITAFGIFSVFLTASTVTGVNLYNAQEKERARNLVLEETQFLLNRISNLIRENAIDYSEYYSNGCDELSSPDLGGAYCSHWENVAGGVAHPDYGDDEGEAFRLTNPGATGGIFAGEYDRRFYYLPTCDSGEVHGDLGGDSFSCDYNDTNNYNEGYFNTGADKILGSIPSGGNDDPARHALMAPENGSTNTEGYEQFELYLISSDGSRKTILRRMGNGEDDDHDGNPDEDAGNFAALDADGNELLGIGELVAQDMNADGFLDGYHADGDFNVDGNGILNVSDFISIVPSQIEIVDLSFLIAPLDDPRKAYMENGDDVQMQPHVMILLTVRPSEKLSRRLVGEDFQVSVQTMVSSRVLNKVYFPSS